MPGSLWLAIFFALVTIGLFFYVRRMKPIVAAYNSRARSSREDPTMALVIGRVCMWIFAGCTVLTLFFSSFNPVGTQNIGIVTSFGKPVGHLGPGLNFTWPWQQVTPMDEAVQVTDYTFVVRIAGSQTADVTIAARWKVNAGASDHVFLNYKNSTSGVENGLLTPELNAATNAVLDGYDPLAPLATGAAAGTPTNPTTTQMAESIQQNLSQRVGSDVTIITLVMKPLVYDKTVQARINSVVNQAAKTDVAKQAIITAQNQAAANKALAASGALNPMALVQQCMSAISDGQLNPPAGFSCWPGPNSGVVIPASK